jgi:cytochrome b6-f complex iron-sulfur subunit
MTDAPVHPCLHRRSVLAVAAGLVGVLAGCGTEPPGEPEAQASTPVQDPPVSGAAPSGAAPSGTAPSDPPPVPEPADGTGVAIAVVAELPVGGGAVVPTKGGPVVLVRAGGDRVSAYRAACPHAGVTVNAPSGGTVTCPAHGSRFRAADGSRISGPATEGLERVRARTVKGQVFLV